MESSSTTIEPSNSGEKIWYLVSPKFLQLLAGKVPEMVASLLNKDSIDDLQVTRFANSEQKGLITQKTSRQKSFLMGNEKNVKQSLRQVKILTRFKQENIIKLWDLLCFNDAKRQRMDSIIFTVNFMPATLADILRCPAGYQQLTPQHIRWLMYQLLCGVKYIHSANIVHRRLKPSNLMIDEHCNLQIADFGEARIAGTKLRYSEYVGTNHYVAPEILLGTQEYTKASDMWSVGCVFAEVMAQGKVLFPGRNCLDQLAKIFEVLGTPTEVDCLTNAASKKYIKALELIPKKPWANVLGSSIAENAADLLDKLLAFDHTKRATVEDALEQDFVKEYRNKAYETKCENPFDKALDEMELSDWKLERLHTAIAEEVARFRSNRQC